MDEEVEKRLSELEQEVKALKGRVTKVENHVSHPPHILKLMEEIRRRKMVTVEDLRQNFPHLYGGILTRLFRAVQGSPNFRIVQGCARWSPTYIIYFENEVAQPTDDAILLAIDYFQRIPIAQMTTTVDAIGRKHRIMKGKQGSLEGIIEAYGVDRDKGYQVWEEILRLFFRETRRIEVNQTAKTFQRKY